MAGNTSFLIIGNGIAGATAAETLRAEDAHADITVVADDPYPVYYRPALKDYLAGKVHEDKLWARPINFYPDRSINFLNEQVVALDPRNHQVQFHSGRTIGYNRLLLAHGALASGLRCPGSNLDGVHTLRTVADYQRVLARLNNVHRVVITGSGTLALETIETLRHRGYHVTHLLRRRTLWSEVLDPIASDLVLQQEQRDGVDVRYEQEITEIVGTNGAVSAVLTTQKTQIACDLVLLGIGIEPLTHFVKSAAIACGRGVKVDATMRTSQPDIYAAGDLTETTDPLTGQTRVIGQWYPAIQQARAAAYSMLDKLDESQVFHFGNFYNASMLYGLDFASVGLSTLPKGQHNYQELQADPQPRTYQKVILKEGRAVGMLGMGNRKHVLAYKRAIDHAVNLTPVLNRLFDPVFNLSAWLDQQGVPPPISAVRCVPRAPKLHTSQLAPVDSPSPTKMPLRGAIAQPDGSLLLPGAQSRLSPSLFAQLRQGPALLVTDKNAARVIPLTPGKRLRIGRDADCEVCLPDMSVSRQHAEIFSFQHGFSIRDLGSSNGVRVNKTRIDNAYHLSNGDCITISSTTIYFTIPQHTISSVTPSPNTKVDDQTHCRHCGVTYPSTARFCPSCGSSFAQTV